MEKVQGFLCLAPNISLLSNQFIVPREWDACFLLMPFRLPQDSSSTPIRFEMQIMKTSTTVDIVCLNFKLVVAVKIGLFLLSISFPPVAVKRWEFTDSSQRRCRQVQHCRRSFVLNNNSFFFIFQNSSLESALFTFFVSITAFHTKEKHCETFWPISSDLALTSLLQLFTQFNMKVAWSFIAAFRDLKLFRNKTCRIDQNM